MKMKLFGMFIDNRKELNISCLESEVETWLQQNPSIDVIHIKQSSNGGSWNGTKIFISVWYEESAS